MLSKPPTPRLGAAERDHWLISRLFGRCHWCRSWLERMIEADSSFLHYLVSQGEDWPHYLCLVRIGLDARPAIPDNPAAHARLISVTARKRLLRDLIRPYPEGLAGSLRRLGCRPMPREAYERLIALLRDRGSRKLLLHSGPIHAAALATLDELPPEFRRCPVAARLKTPRERAAFEYDTRVVRRVHAGADPADLHRQLGRIRDMQELASWFQRQIARIPFPEPPWGGNEWLRPVRDAATLSRVARKMENCARNYLEEILKGVNCLYVVAEKPGAAVLLERDAYCGWVIDQIKGPRNRTVGSGLRRRITEALTAAGIGFAAKPEVVHHVHSLLDESGNDL